ncbi:Lrp/AsnC family transcriptional regulator [Leucobacter sp. HY1910]
MLSEMDRRIVSALQIDGRASWNTVAKALGEPLRTVARRGKELLESGRVRVVGLANLGPTCVIEITCRPARLQSLAQELAEHPGVVYVFVLASPTSLLIEVHEQTFDLATMTLTVIPEFDGVLEVSATPVLRYFKTNAHWNPVLVAGDDASRPNLALGHEESTAPPETLDAPDRAIVAALERDGRVGVAELADVAGVTEPTARKRLAELQARGAFAIRVLADPVDLGYPVEVSVKLYCSPQDAEAVGLALAAVPECRYAAQVLGEHSIVAHFNARDLPHVRAILAEEWIARVRTVHASLVTKVLKRGGRLSSTHVA